MKYTLNTIVRELERRISEDGEYASLGDFVASQLLYDCNSDKDRIRINAVNILMRLAKDFAADPDQVVESANDREPAVLSVFEKRRRSTGA